VGITIVEKDENSLESNDIFYINGDIDEDVADYFIRFLLEREIQPKKPEYVKVIISSDGGYIDNCMAMIDTMRGVSFPVHTYALGHIYSCGLLLFMSGTRGHRYIFKNCMALSHQWSGGSEGKKHEIEASEKANKMNTAKIFSLYKEAAPELTADQINNELLPASDVFMSPKEVVKYGLADKVITKFW
jgi:ATP-dependent Clp protease, protease subunit